MKKSLFTVFIIALCVFLSECNKSPKPDVFKITEVNVDASYKTAKINGTYSFNVVPDNIKLIYGEKDDLTDAISANVDISGDDFSVSISDLRSGTKYFYCFECLSSHSYKRSEVYSFETFKIDKPSVKTSEVRNISKDYANCGGDVTSDNGAAVTERGVCWSTSPNPTINDNKTDNGTGTGSFTSQLSNLTLNTTYYVRAYATNNIGTGYGEQKVFTTLEDIELPTVKTNDVTNITHDAVTCGGVVEQDGGTEVTVRGVCWSTSENPTISDSHTENGSGEGSFSSDITGLTANTTYHVRAYATNSKGTAYGDEKTFVTSIIMNLPVVITHEIDDITESSAVSGGEVVSDGGAAVTERGICWSTSQNPSINDNKTNDGTGTGSFTSQLSNLSPNTTYYVRAYATNISGTSYGEQRTFNTSSVGVTLPTVTTSAVTDITHNSVTCGGNVTDDGGAAVTERGVCWSTSPYPTINDNKTTNGSGTGTFTSQLSNLVPQTTYYVKAYATNENGTAYGEVKTFKTKPEETICEPDGKIDGYDYVDLGLPSGLKWATCNIGASSAEAYGDYFAWGETNTKAEYTEDNSLTYGLTITQLQAQGYIDGNNNLTPQHDAATANWGGSWRMPTEEEMRELLDNCTWKSMQVNGVNGAKVIGPNGSCIFLPIAGYHGDPTDRTSENGYFWSSTPFENTTNDAYFLSFGSSPQYVGWGSRGFGRSVRPVSGGNTTEPEPTLPTVTTSAVSNVTANSATSGGNVTSDGGATVTARGICWSMTQNPTLDDNDGFTSDGTGTGTFVSLMECLESNTTYYVRAYATNSEGTGYGDEKSFTTEQGQLPSGTINGHDYIDLGLPSGLLWATCNIGASFPREYGNYYAWGETATKTEYTMDNSLTYGENVGNNISGNPQYDAATANWGDGWRMPTEEEMEELIDECDWEWMTICGHNVYKVTGQSGKFIYLPMAGDRINEGEYEDETEPHNTEVCGRYWSATGSYTHAQDLAIGQNEKRTGSYYKYAGRSVRPVSGGDHNEEPEPTLPTVTTSAVTDVTTNSATCGGNVTSDGGAAVTARGVCWSTSHNPTTNDNKTADGSGTGTFTSNLTNLTANITYYVRAYATNEKGTSYGEEKSFTTEEEGIIIVNGVSFKMIFVEGGTFYMGATSEQGSDASTSELPVHEVTLSDYYISETEVTQELWTAVLGNNPSHYSGEQKPVETVSWHDCQDFISALNELTGLNFSLPTEAEWEYAARGGKMSQGYKYSGSNTLDDVAWYTENSGSKSHDVKTKSPNELGIYDMSGNIDEWCQDWYGNYSSDPQIDPTGPLSGTACVLRGGSWLDRPSECRISHRTSENPANKNSARGFRIAISTHSGEEPEPTPPTVTTSAVSNITYSSASSGGNVTSDGGATVTARGVCWSTSHNPTTNDNKTTDGSGTGTFTSNLTNLTANTTYYVRAYATNEKGTSYGDEKSFTTEEEEEEEEGCEPDGEINGYGYVDLGLPSGVKWATINVGASSPEEYGDYYAWGETNTKTKYTTANSLTYGLTETQLQAQGIIDGEGNLTPQHDVATANWGGSWRMPAEEEIQELVDNCTWEWTQVNGVNGAKFIGPNGSCIFLPAAGYRYGTSLFNDGGRGRYWSSMPDDYDDYCACGLLFYDGDEGVISILREYGQTVRPVSGENATEPEPTLPTVTTSSVTDVTTNSATSGGNVTSDGGTTVTARGVCWSTSPNPSINDNKTTDGSGIGTFTSNLTNLTANTTYYVRAYATNEKGTSYGEEKSFTTLVEISLPTVTTSNVITNITTNSATCGGNVTFDGNTTVTSRGICWSEYPNPTINDNKTTDGSGKGSFTSTLINLTENTTYYVRAYATNEKGTSYGEERSFKTLDTPTINGHEYVDLGLPSGLKWATCNVGASKPQDYGNYYAWGETETKTEYTQDNSLTYGLTISELQSQGYIDGSGNLTPSHDAATANWGGSWRMPTKEELEELMNECTWTWTTQNGVNGRKVKGPNGNHIFLPAAGGRLWSSLGSSGEYGYYWSSTPDESGNYIAYRLYFDSGGWSVFWIDRYGGRSVRPVSGNYNYEPITQLPSVTTNDITNITSSSATCGGNVTSDGNATVTSRGICWSTSHNPTTNDNKTTDGSGTGTFTSNLTNLTANTTYYVRAYATNEKGTSYGDEKSFTTEEEEEEEETSGYINGHEYVDLGLPSGVKWATINVGASSPEEYGDYYAWGETNTKTEYTKANSLTYGLTETQLQAQGYIDGSLNLTPQHDAAAANWGGSWRMPTKEEMQELVDNCTWEWTQVNGVNGAKVIGPNGSCIFLPAAGWRNETSLLNEGDYGYCWSSTPNDYYDDRGAYGLRFYGGNEDVGSYGYRSYGQTVRPVSGGDHNEEPESTLPTVTTSSVTDVTTNSATSGGNVTSDGGATVTARGICWSTSHNPTTNDNKTADGSGIGTFTSNLTNLTANTTYYVRAYATNEKGTSYGDEKSFTTEEEEEEEEISGYINGHEYVDLGLPSGVKWATCNVGASSSEEYGDYYAWGETNTKTEYTTANSLTHGLTETQLQAQGIIDGEGNLTPQHDAAVANWGGSWRMPAKEEIQELVDNCTWEWTEVNGVDGYNVTGPNGSCIFLPAAGYRSGSSLGLAGGYYGYYWSSTPNVYDYDIHAYSLRFNGGDETLDYYTRYSGHTVRPITE